MKIRLAVAILLFCATMNAHAEGMLLKATYTPVKGSDVEYGQGAIERNELAHREISPNVWLILVEEGTPAEWERRLNAAVDPKHGSFRVNEASEEERRKVKSGEITLQK